MEPRTFRSGVLCPIAAQQAPAGQIAEAVADAKNAAKTETSLITMSEGVIHGPIWAEASGKTVLGARVDTRRPEAVATPDLIFTWHLLHVTRRYQEATALVDADCRAPYPPSWPTPVGDEIAIATFGGTMTFDGVQVTLAERESHVPILLALQNYVLVGQPCRPGIFSLHLEYPVDGAGRLLDFSGRPLKPGVTIDTLPARLKQR